VNIAFFDRIDWDYDVATPYERALGGAQSAQCYLAVALADRGHSVAMYTGATKPRVFRGVRSFSIKGMARDSFATCDVVIVCNGSATNCLPLRRMLPQRCRLILWSGYAPDQPDLFELRRPEVRAGWDGIVCVSQWHAAEMQRHYGLDPNRVAVLRNAIGPAFENLFPDAGAMAKAKSSAPVLAYTSTPFRGLQVLLAIFPEVHRHDERVRLHVYSSMKVYGQDESNDAFTHLYAKCRSTPGIDYVGAIAQPLLAEALKSSLILAYPNTFPETSCIAVMEAMAAGMLVVTSDLGALSETTMGMGALVPPARIPQELPAFARTYTDRLIAALEESRRDPRQFWAARWEQIRAVTTQCTWAIRAAEWEEFLQARMTA
jgi:glycosyltransferase involved in cell wall biosynthesis